jgi:opacity protein-like surface antigen
MRHRVTLLFASLFLLSTAAPARAQWNDYKKWEISPFVGFETSGSYPINNSPTFDRLRANSGLSFGTFVGYSLTENAQAELLWGRSNTSFSARDMTTRTYTKIFNSDIDHVQFGFLYMLRNSELKLRPFIAASIGFTHESNDANPNRTLFGYGLGGGVKYTVTPHFALRGDARWLPSRANKTPGVICDQFYGCYQQNISNYLEFVNLSGGFAFRF